DVPELTGVRRAVEAGDWAAARAEWARHLETRERPRWVWSGGDRDDFLAAFEARGAPLRRYAAAADRVLARDFEWLGVRKKLDRDIEWLQGPVEWTHVLSRFSYWKTLGHAYWGTGDSKYAEDFVYMLRDWIADNPVPRVVTNSRGPRGTVWRTLEAGIRGDAWFDVMELFMFAPEFDAEAKYLMTKSLVEHARHLHRYETAFRYGNWQVVECTGLAAIGIMLPEFKEAPAWRERAFDYLRQHMERDVYPDGAHHELTPGYHGWVMERFLKVSLLCKANGYDVPGLMDKHERMFEFLMHVSKPDGRYASLGDASRGGSIRANMGLGALLYHRPDMRHLGIDAISGGWLWLFGPDVGVRYAELAARPPDFTSAMLPDAKYCVMRTGWEPDDKYLLFDCAPWGGGHSHQDRLQVVVYAGRDLLIDPGIYSYDQPLSRTYFRQSEAHNILLIDGEEQLQSDPKVLAWSVTESADFAAGEIADAERGLRHRRSVLFVKPDYWVVVDHVFGGGEKELTRLFHFPLVEVTADGNSAHTAFPDGANILVAAADHSRLEMRKGWIPTGGATAKEAPVAAFVARRELPAALCTVLVPFGSADDLPKIEM
ncbi:MAG: alginate lyase family protein, partial [Armatimonadota bacterium]